MYTHVSKCKNDEMKGEKHKIIDKDLIMNFRNFITEFPLNSN
jgi:hypothetical protein